MNKVEAEWDSEVSRTPCSRMETGSTRGKGRGGGNPFETRHFVFRADFDAVSGRGVRAKISGKIALLIAIKWHKKLMSKTVTI